ncbi:MAG: PSD1 and planctomycete cytochrome C domain-containing protein [Novipirellula sp. JB048]
MSARFTLRGVGLIGCAVALLTATTRSPAADPPLAELAPLSGEFDPSEFEYFERKIRPLLSEHCFVCHSAEAKTVHGGLRLDSASGIAVGGDSGALLVPGKPEESLLIETIHYESFEMPPQGKLSAAEIAALTEWVRRGAPFPPAADQPARPDGEIDFDLGRQFWSFQPLREQPLPEVTNADWPQTRIDSFVIAAMEAEGLTPAPRADRATLIRRLSFALTGLPPTPERLAAFLEDDAPQAYERLVDELLESPQYGEKWGRWWLDMARYTDRTASWLPKTSQAHLYRDWVVQAFNDDLPYDEFIHRQLATDLMPQTGPEDLTALGFLSLSPAYWKELKLPSELIKVIVADEWEERVDAVSRTFLGLTVACARCHDHKFDPISADDYYGLAGIFASTRHLERPLVSEEAYAPVRAAKAEIAKLEAEITKLKKQKPLPQEQIDELSGKIEQIKTSTPLFDTPLAHALAEESMYVVRAGDKPEQGTKLEYRPGPRDLPSFIRGNPNRPGPLVPRRFLTVLTSTPRPYQNGSGRLELAQSITTEAQALTARVLVNRVWLAHFNQGIVATPSNFGQQGSRPTHPQLLDDLAARFVREGWSIKRLHREILLSASWQQSSAVTVDRDHPDPENRWLARGNRRRLSFEEWRDAMLAVSDQLDLTPGGLSTPLEAAGNRRRTLYATIDRRDLSPTLMVHDFPDANQHSPMRTATVTPLQGLFAINSPMLREQARGLANRLQQSSLEDDSSRIRQAYLLLFSREPNARELELGLAYLAPSQVPVDAESEAVSTRWHRYAHVLLASNEFIFID